MMIPVSRSTSLRIAAVLCITSIAGRSQTNASSLDPAHYRQVDAVLRASDKNGDNLLQAEELRNAETEVLRQHGRRGVGILTSFVTAADTDRNGALSEAEWTTLGSRLHAEQDVLKQTVQVHTRDGQSLATDVYRPLTGGPFPVILMRTPYGRRRDRTPGLVRHGFAVVIQDMRGRFDSSGENLPFIGCGWAPYTDGVDTCQWLLEQPWCNGSIGTLGGSAGGITQNLLAGADPRGLRCQVIQVAAASLYHHAAYVGGALRLSQVERWLQGNEFAPKAVELYREHHCYDEFWQDFDSTTKHNTMTVPAMHIGGWFDTFALGTVTSFSGRQTQGADGARGTQILVMGPWAHGGFRDQGRVGELTFPQARAPRQYNARDWFDYWLREKANGMSDLAPVAYYVMGDTENPDAPGNEWRFAQAWPIPCETSTFYLHADGTLSRRKPDAAARDAGVSYRFDPRQPCPTRGGCNLTLPAGPMDQRPLEKRDDVVVFTTETLAAPLEITGHGKAVLAVSSSAVDTDLSVRLCDVYPDGRSFLMAEGMRRCRMRDRFDRHQLLSPGAVYTVDVDLWPTSVIIDQGHRLRLTVTSSNYPRFDVNPGTGKPWENGQTVHIQNNTVHCGPVYSSHILLPTP